MMHRRNKKILSILLVCLLFAALAAAAISGYKLWRYYQDYADDRDLYDDLRDEIIETVPETDAEEETSQQKADSASVPFGVDWDALKAVNSDIVGWVYFTGLPQISYPILQADDNEYYVHRTYDLSSDSSKAGSIFMDYRMNSDFSSPYSIVYGHNVHDGSMFSDLPQLKDQALYDAEPYFWILTPQGNYRYQIFSIFQCHRSADVFQKSFSSWSADFLSWQQELKSRNTMQGDVELSDDSHIIAFSTCVPNSFDRTIVCGVYIDGDEISNSDQK